MARICVIRQGVYPYDARVTREVRSLLAAGHEVDLVCLQWGDLPRSERDGRLTVHRLAVERRHGGKLRYLLEYAAFFVAAALLVTRLHLRHRFDLVQVNSLPDCLVFAAAVPRLLGARVLLDLHECMPEFFALKYRLSPRHPLVRLLGSCEQLSIRFADAAITCTEPMRQRFVERGAPAGKVGVVLNSFDDERFDPRRYAAITRNDGRFMLVFHGTIDHMYGLDLVIRAVAALRDRIPNLTLRIYGDGPRRASLEALATELDVADRVWFSRGWLPLDELLPRIAEADAGVVAIRRDACFDLTHSNKMFDLIALRKPVVISRTRAVEAYFDEGCFELFESGNEHDLARAIYDLHRDPERRRRLVERAAQVGEPYRWSHQAKRYVGVVDRLIESAGREPLATGQVEHA
ncbi:MAG TPA: glycosyltransferase family 4 protein [Candidatus Limnocylindria bacterium]|nr:glycosyltransferase family 4 protein [Candidatus Limnocylindria bacterium]